MSKTLRRLLLSTPILLLLIAAHLMRWDARALLWLQEWRGAPLAATSALWLPGYRAVTQLEVPGFEKEEFSGLAYDAQSDSLFAVSGKQPLLVELSLDGKELRRIALEGASNLEGVAVLGDGYMAVSDERRKQLSIFRIEAATTRVGQADILQQVDLDIGQDGNKGFEALTWDGRNQRLLLGTEKYPVMLYALPVTGQRVSGALQPLTDLGGLMTDLSGLAVDPRNGQLLVLSQESHLLVGLDPQGRPQSFLALLPGLNGLRHFVPRAEGVAMDGQGTVYVVSERNLFLALRKETEAR